MHPDDLYNGNLPSDVRQSEIDGPCGVRSLRFHDGVIARIARERIERIKAAQRPSPRDDGQPKDRRAGGAV